MTGRLVSLFGVVVLGFFTAYESLQVWRAYTSRKWPTTQGLVIAFYGNPEYRYSVGGRSYTNSYVSCNELFNSLWAPPNSSKYAVRYPLAAKVDVRYCPRRPALAVLETKFDRSGITLVVSLVLATTVFLIGFLFGARFRVVGLGLPH